LKEKWTSEIETPKRGKLTSEGKKSPEKNGLGSSYIRGRTKEKRGKKLSGIHCVKQRLPRRVKKQQRKEKERGSEKKTNVRLCVLNPKKNGHRSRRPRIKTTAPLRGPKRGKKRGGGVERGEKKAEIAAATFRNCA